MDIKTLKDFWQNLLTSAKEFPSKFKKMSLGEQIAYVCIALGMVLIAVSLFLF